MPVRAEDGDAPVLRSVVELKNITLPEILNRAPGEKLLEFGFTNAAKSTVERISNKGNLTDVPRIADSEQYWYLIDDENNAVLIHIK